MANNLDILLIDSDYIKKRSTVMANVEEDFFAPAIFAQQNIVIQKIMGSPLYDEMIGEYEDYYNHVASGGTSGVTAFVETRFLDLTDKYIQPALLYYTLYEVSYDLYAKNTNKSVTVQSSENSFPADIAFVEKRRADYKNKGEFYAERMMKYLMDNTTLFHNFLSYSSSDISTIPPETNTNYFNGMYLKKSCNYESEIAKMKRCCD